MGKAEKVQEIRSLLEKINISITEAREMGLTIEIEDYIPGVPGSINNFMKRLVILKIYETIPY